MPTVIPPCPPFQPNPIPRAVERLKETLLGTWGAFRSNLTSSLDNDLIWFSEWLGKAHSTIHGAFAGLGRITHSDFVCVGVDAAKQLPRLDEILGPSRPFNADDPELKGLRADYRRLSSICPACAVSRLFAFLWDVIQDGRDPELVDDFAHIPWPGSETWALSIRRTVDWPERETLDIGGKVYALAVGMANNAAIEALIGEGRARAAKLTDAETAKSTMNIPGCIAIPMAGPDVAGGTKDDQTAPIPGHPSGFANPSELMRFAAILGVMGRTDNPANRKSFKRTHGKAMKAPKGMRGQYWVDTDYKDFEGRIPPAKQFGK